MDTQQLAELAKLIRYYCLVSTTTAGSGHPSSSLSATDLMTVLMFGGHFRFKADEPHYWNNDRLIFSKGHAAPLLYALWAAAGKVSMEELKQLRRFGSNLEGHPTMEFPYTEAATGSLGQGLSIGLGMALNAKYLDALPYKTWVLLGDSEMAEGSVWKAVQLAAHYKLGNLIGVLDVNRLGQRGETMHGADVIAYDLRLQAFGWNTYMVQGHNVEAVSKAYEFVLKNIDDKPTMIIAKTMKGKGVSLMEDKEGWHGKALSEEECKQGIEELGEISYQLRGEIASPEKILKPSLKSSTDTLAIPYQIGDIVATRKAYGDAPKQLTEKNSAVVALDAEVSNSTYSALVKDTTSERFFEMYIAEQNMIGTAVGLAKLGKIPFVSTFSAFLTRAFDQLRMAQYGLANIKVVGSHAGVSIGEDGSSQMGLEDISMFRSILKSVVLYPADAVATTRLVALAAKQPGLVYLRTSRPATPVIYEPNEVFVIGGCKVLRESQEDVVTLISAGVTLYEALKAHEMLKCDNIMVRVIDLYSIQPIDRETLLIAAKETRSLVTVEDHYPAGGLGEAVMSALADVQVPIFQMAVTKMPHSGTGDELLAFEEINAEAIVNKIKMLV